jgi:hypothetical protein
MKRLSDKECFDKLTTSECYVKTVNDADKNKVKKARAGTNPTTPSSKIAQVAAELGLRAFAQDPKDPPPVEPPPSNPWDSGYAPRSYNMGSRGQNCKFNVHINCTLRSDGFYVDKKGIVYQDNGLCLGGRNETPDIPQLKPSDMSDGLEPWDAYEWNGTTIGPNKENYPADSYKE